MNKIRRKPAHTVAELASARQHQEVGWVSFGFWSGKAASGALHRSMAGRVSGAGGRLPVIRHGGVGGFTARSVHSGKALATGTAWAGLCLIHHHQNPVFYWASPRGRREASYVAACQGPTAPGVCAWSSVISLFEMQAPHRNERRGRRFCRRSDPRRCCWPSATRAPGVAPRRRRECPQPFHPPSDSESGVEQTRGGGGFVNAYRGDHGGKRCRPVRDHSFHHISPLRSALLRLSSAFSR